jgi:phosphoribosylamine--glycine ligase
VRVPDRVNVLLLGTGGREHAIAWKLRQSPRLGDLWVEPGANAGLLGLGRPCPAPIDPKQAFRLNRWCEEAGIDLVVIGPEGPLEQDFATLLAAPGRAIFGPSRSAARLEWDKAYAKSIMRAASIPTAEGRAFDSIEAALAFVRARPSDEGLVVKAAGLCAGKGVFVCRDRAETVAAVERIMGQKAFGDAGGQVVIEERLSGQELSVLALVDGRTIHVLDPAQDHKQVGEGDTGDNTGGMGAYCPTPLATDRLLDQVQREVLVPAIDALRREGVVFRGVLYAGLMLTPAGPKVLEFNTRFGDPETQPLLARLQGDLVEILWATATGTLAGVELSFDPRTALCVVVCSEGYPGPIRKGFPITGLDEAAGLAGPGEELVLFHAGTARGAAPGDPPVTAGGRVLGVTAIAADLPAAQRLANRAAEAVRFDGAFFRRDIGWRVLGSPLVGRG